MKSKRKYYKENRDAELIKAEIHYRCPNTNKYVKITPNEWDWRGYEDRLGGSVSVHINCSICKKHHTISVRDN